MNYLQRAIQAASRLEQDLQSLISEASSEGNYQVVTELASLAGEVRRLFKTSQVASSSVHVELPRPERRKESAKGEPPMEKVRAHAADKYPLFETESDRLVKIGWSKKAKSTYEHKAPRNVCESVSLMLAAAGTKNSFRMEDNVDLRDSDGQEIPSYQSYLVLAWLRWLGLVEKDGKGGYAWTPESFGAEDFESAWSKTPTRRGGK
jgi:hypothetical protein